MVLGVQAAVDRATIAHMWHFMRDAHFIDGKTQSLIFKLVVNLNSRTVALWSMRLAFLPSGQLQSYATVLSAPLLWRETVSVRDLLKFTTLVMPLLLSCAHAAFLSELHLTPGSHFGRPANEYDAALRSSRWFCRLCQVACVGLAASFAGSWYLNQVITQQVNNFSIQRVHSIPPPTFCL